MLPGDPGYFQHDQEEEEEEGPSIQPGKHGNSVYLQNVNNQDDNSLTVDTIGTCLTEIETCSNGMTLAFWVKPSHTQPQSDPFPHLIASSSILIYTRLVQNGLLTRYLIQSASQEDRYDFNMPLQFEQWSLVAVTYSAQSGAEVYLNGCIVKIRKQLPKSKSRVANKLIVGCHKGYSRCVHGNFDDLRLWTSKKDKYFMWTLWSI